MIWEDWRFLVIALVIVALCFGPILYFHDFLADTLSRWMMQYSG
jgi:ABC-type bacteriocin/lantibiotic exporter with double-glycine peptidase domain